MKNLEVILKGSFLRNYAYVILINNDIIEFYNIENEEITSLSLPKAIDERLLKIESSLQSFSKKKNIVIVGEPIIFYKEYKKRDKASLLVDEPNPTRYRMEKLESFDKDKYSVKYFKKSFFKLFSSNCVIIDLFELLSYDLGKDSAIIKNYESNEIQIFESSRRYWKADKIGLINILELESPALYSFFDTGDSRIKSLFKDSIRSHSLLRKIIYDKNEFERKIVDLYKSSNVKNVSKETIKDKIAFSLTAIFTFVFLAVLIEFTMLLATDKCLLTQVNELINLRKQIKKIEIVDKNFVKNSNDLRIIKYKDLVHDNNELEILLSFLYEKSKGNIEEIEITRDKSIITINNIYDNFSSDLQKDLKTKGYKELEIREDYETNLLQIILGRKFYGYN